jgi:hypothetical protein
MQGSNLRPPVLENDGVCVRPYRVVILCMFLRSSLRPIGMVCTTPLRLVLRSLGPSLGPKKWRPSPLLAVCGFGLQPDSVKFAARAISRLLAVLYVIPRRMS